MAALWSDGRGVSAASYYVAPGGSDAAGGIFGKERCAALL
jgi:hypothetical protein